MSQITHPIMPLFLCPIFLRFQTPLLFHDKRKNMQMPDKVYTFHPHHLEQCFFGRPVKKQYIYFITLIHRFFFVRPHKTRNNPTNPYPISLNIDSYFFGRMQGNSHITIRMRYADMCTSICQIWLPGRKINHLLFFSAQCFQ